MLLRSDQIRKKLKGTSRAKLIIPNQEIVIPENPYVNVGKPHPLQDKLEDRSDFEPNEFFVEDSDVFPDTDTYSEDDNSSLDENNDENESRSEETKITLSASTKRAKRQAAEKMGYFTQLPKRSDYKEIALSTPMKEEWLKVITSDEYQALLTQREQIRYCFDHLSGVEIAPSLRFTHAQIAAKFGISRQVAERQVKKAKEGVAAPHRPCILTNEEKENLLQYLQESWRNQEWPSYQQVNEYIEAHFEKEISDDTLRHIIANNFKDNVKVVDGEPLEDKRFKVSYDAISGYLDKLASILPFIDYRFVYNLDETGEEEFVDTRSIKVLVPSDFPDKKAKIPVRRGKKRFTIVHCICTDGGFIPPYIIVPRKTINSDIYKIYNPDQICFKYQQKGFMNDVLFKGYFNDHFLNCLSQKRQQLGYEGDALLIMDNLLAHKKAVGCPVDQDHIYIPEVKLHILFLVPHSSDQTQPLDLGIFGSQKRMSQNVKRKKGLSSFSQSLNRALQGIHQSSSPRAITSAFEQGGILRNVIYDKQSNKCIIKLFVCYKKCRAIRGIKSPEEKQEENEMFQRIRIDT